ncbi:MAG: gliding motility-associated C-terminal domain-containing protein [Crocinitomicaceae bacterium]|nr:gliding motility-associated C-terminal domain-containing protein [Crocinitomicaceae bacterium]
MGNLLKSLTIILAIGVTHIVHAQCNVTSSAVTSPMVCGDSVTIYVTGYTSGPVLSEDFNGMSLGPGWSSSQVVDYSNPCGPSLDGTPSAWMGSVATQPRKLETNGFDLQCGAQICFDFDMAMDDPCGSCSSCEDPDASNEGVHLQYSIDNGVTWIDIFYFQPVNTGQAGHPYYSWENWCFDLPPGGWSANTKLRWYQQLGSGSGWDHWGIDNVTIQPIDCNNNYYVVYDDGTNNSVGDSDTTLMLTSSMTYDITYTNGIDDTCTTQVAVTVDPYNISVSANNPNLSCGQCTDISMVLNNPPQNNNTANIYYIWTPDSALVDQFSPTTTSCPSDSIYYTATIIDSTTGCMAQDSILIAVSGGGAIADFSVFPGLSGCPPFDVVFTNTGDGQSFEWFIDGVSQATTTNFQNTFPTTGSYEVMVVAYMPGAGCVNYDTASVTIEVLNSVTPVADFDFAYQCGNTNLDIWNTGSQGLQYDWDMGDGNTYTGVDSLTHSYANTGTYTITLTITDPTCGTTDTYTEDVNIVDNPISFIFNNPTCHDFSDGSVTVNLLYNTGSETYVITDDQGTQLNVGGSNAANNLNGGWYFIDVDLGFGCQVADSVELWNPDEIVPNVTTSDVLCNGDATGTAIVDTVYGWQGNYNNLAFFWNPQTGQNGIGADSAMNISAGNYVLTINDGNGCSNTFSFTINEPPPLVFSEIGSDPAYCRVFNYQNGNGVVWASATGGTPDYDYVWINLQDSSLTSNTTWGGQNPGQYEIIVEDNNGCVLSQIITIDEVSPIADFTVFSDSLDANLEGTAPVTVVLTNQSQYFANPNNPNADTTFYWNLNYDNPPGWIISHDINETMDTTYLDGGVYTVCLVAINKNGCTDTLCKDITVFDPLQFDVVNIFTPNNDGANDEFTFVYKADAVAEFQCTVVDRWGKTIREFTNITDTWDGTDMNGSEVTDGVYFYIYSGTAENGETFEGQGTVTLIRGKQ